MDEDIADGDKKPAASSRSTRATYTKSYADADDDDDDDTIVRKKKFSTAAASKKKRKKVDDDDDSFSVKDDEDDDVLTLDNDDDSLFGSGGGGKQGGGKKKTRPSRTTNQKNYTQQEGKKRSATTASKKKKKEEEDDKYSNDDDVVTKNNRQQRRLTIVILITRSSPNTKDTAGKFQKHFCISALKYLHREAGYFPNEYKLIVTPHHQWQSAYNIAGSRMLLDVTMYLKKYINHKVVIAFSDIQRIGRDSRNINIFMDTVQKLHRNVELYPLSTIGMSLKQARDMIDKLRLDRQKVYKTNKKSIEKVSVTKQEEKYQVQIMKVFKSLTQHQLEPHRRYVSNALNQDNVIIGLDDEQPFLDEVRSIICECKTVTPDQICQSLVELGDYVDLRKSAVKTRVTVHYYRSSSNSVEVEGNPNNLLLTAEDLPEDQWKHIVAAMIVQKHKSDPRWIFYDKNINKTTITKKGIGMGIVKLIALIVADQVDTIFIKDHTRFPTKLVPIIIALCRLRNTNIVAAEKHGKDFVVLAKAEQIRQEGNRKTTTDHNEALEACMNEWNDQQRLVYNYICDLKSKIMGERMVGNTISNKVTRRQISMSRGGL